MRGQNLTKEELLAQINIEIDALQDECAEKIAEIIGDAQTRILSYTKEQEMNKIVEKYSKKIAKLIVDKEELEKE